MEFYTGNIARAERMSKDEPMNLHPDRIEQLRSLGYIR